MIADEELLRRFEAQAFTNDAWTHRLHVRIGYLYLVAHPFDVALGKVRSGIQALNAANQVPDTPTRGYHETITIAWLALIDAMLAARGPAEDSEAFLDREPYLAVSSLLRLYYSKGGGTGPAGKRVFVEPDLAGFPQGRWVGHAPRS